uniref:Uncharacterized protein n=1 Tax=Anguilla anguilla TaxID=7936 RepID=A0A0E9PI78_ANGAN
MSTIIKKKVMGETCGTGSRATDSTCRFKKIVSPLSICGQHI